MKWYPMMKECSWWIQTIIYDLGNLTVAKIAIGIDIAEQILAAWHSLQYEK